VPGPGLQEAEHVPERFIRLLLAQVAERVLAADHLGYPLDQMVDRADEVGDAGGDGVAGHHRVFGLGRVLDEDDAALLLDGLDADRAGRTGPGHHHCQPVAAAGGDRAEEHVDRRPPAARLAELAGLHVVALDDQLAVGRNDIDAVGTELRRISHLVDRHGGAAGQDLAHVAGVVGRQVDDHHVGEAQVVGDAAEEFLQGGHPAGRGADRADRRQLLVPFLLLLVDLGHRNLQWPHWGARSPWPMLQRFWGIL